jgi:hypothetical protein
MSCRCHACCKIAVNTLPWLWSEKWRSRFATTFLLTFETMTSVKVQKELLQKGQTVTAWIAETTTVVVAISPPLSVASRIIPLHLLHSMRCCLLTFAS